MSIRNERTMVDRLQLRDFARDNGVGKFNLCMDCGSTETRSATFSAVALPTDVMAIPSGYSVITTNIDNVKSNSKNLGDNLEMVLKDVTLGKVDRAFESVRIAKCELMNGANFPIEKAVSNEGKASQEPTYINIISNIAIRLVEKVILNKKLYNANEIDLTVSLPTRDTESPVRINKFKKKLAGLYVVDFPRLDLSINFILKESDIYVEDESQAALRFWATTNAQKMGAESQSLLETYKRVIIIDGGGSTIDFSLLENQVIKTKGSRTSAFGGTKFEQDVIADFVKTHDADRPTQRMIHDALETGLMQNGNSFIDITGNIKNAKIETAKFIFRDLNKLFDEIEMKSEEINAVITCGGLFKESSNHTTKVPSLSNYIKMMYQKKSPNTEFGRITEEFPLVYGLALYRMSL